MAEVRDEIDWWSFICCGCAERTYVGFPRDGQALDLGESLLMLYGDPPFCTECQNDARPRPNRATRRAQRHHGRTRHATVPRRPQ